LAAALVIGVVSIGAARTWTSRDGKFTVDAELDGVKDGVVKLKKTDGSVIDVPLDKLSAADQEYIEGQGAGAASSGGEFRKWTSKDGKFTVRAKFIKFADGKVHLKRADGTTLAVFLSKFCDEDRAWVKRRLPKRKKRGKQKQAGDEDEKGELGPGKVAMRLVPLNVGKHKQPDALTRRILQMTQPQSFYFDSSQKNGHYEKRFKAIVDKEPKYQYKKPIRGVVRLGSGEYAFALDAVGKKVECYNRLYFDANRNGDLTDDKPVTTKDITSNKSKVVTRAEARFDKITASIDVKGTKVDHTFGLGVSCTQTKTRSYAFVRVQSLVYREGEIEEKGRKIRVILLDRNNNGQFGDPIACRQAGGRISVAYGDVLLINPALRGSRAVSADQDFHYVNKMLRVGKQFYRLDVSPTGDALTLEPTTLTYGYASNKSGVYQALICSDEYGVLQIGGLKDQKIQMPTGKWRIASYTIGAPGRDGTKVFARFSGRSPEVEIEKGKTSELPFGEPFRAKVVAHRLPNKKVALSLSIEGRSGARCSDIRADGKRPPAPTFEVRDQDGKVVYRGKFEYG
jgi:hypothetical protein